jgi:hypothetical protein
VRTNACGTGRHTPTRLSSSLKSAKAKPGAGVQDRMLGDERLSRHFIGSGSAS